MNAPKKIKFIQPVKKEEIAKYYTFADAILGEFKTGHTNSIEREAALCKKAVLCFNDINQKSFLDGNEVETPFLPKSQDPKIIAELIDKIVLSSEFRENLADLEFNFMKKLCEPNKAVVEWENVFQTTYKKFQTIEKKSSLFHIKMKKLFFDVGMMFSKKNIEN